MQIHRDAFNGDSEAVAHALDAGVPVDATDSQRFTPLMLAVASPSSNIRTIQILLQHGADPNAVGGSPPTEVLGHALTLSDSDRVRLLLDAGARIADEEIFNSLLWSAYSNQPRLPEVVGLLLDRGVFKSGRTEQNAIAQLDSQQIIRLLTESERDLNDLDPETRSYLLGLEYDSEPKISREDFEAGRQPHFGNANPEKMDIPFWRAMVQSGASADTARKMFVPEEKIFEEEQRAPIWSYQRSGKSITALPDGRIIEIGGGHEDWYDSDFHLYNEVFVHHPAGHFDIYGYPTEVFPPTDFHSATLVGDSIYIIGSLGHPRERILGCTPVYRLNTKALTIEKINTIGELPGSISMHEGCLKNNEIHVCGGECTEVFILNLDTHYWRRETN